MKVNVVMLGIALAIAALAAFGFFSGNSGEAYRWVITIGSGITFFITLGGLLALSSPHGGTANIKAISVVFFIVFLIEHLVFTFAPLRIEPYIIITGIVLLIYILIAYAINRALK